MLRIGNMTFHMGPSTIGGPDDLEAAILEFIAAARSSLDVAVQELESRPIAEALIAVSQRGVRVRIVLEGDYLIDDNPASDPFQAVGAHEANRVLFNALLRAGIDARTDYNAKIFHQKFIVRDIDETGAGWRAVLTGSTNFTPTGTAVNLNHVITVRGAAVAREYDKEFREIWDGISGTSRQRHEPKPRNSRVSGVRVKVLFAIFTFSQSSDIDDTMIALRRADITVQGVFDPGQGNQTWAATRGITASGADVFLASDGQGLGKLHHKLMVIDRQVVIAGSFNYTGPANALNDENIIIGDIDEDTLSGRQNQAAFAGFAADEIGRIIQRHGRRVPPATP